MSPAAQRMVTIALDGSVRLGRLINDILDVERIHSGVMPMNVGEHSVRRDSSRSPSPRCGSSPTGRRSRSRSDAIEGEVLTDRDRTEQTLINLLDNAVKFSPPELHGDASTPRRWGRSSSSWSRDSGRGIPPDKLTSIFRRFEQVDSSDARDRGGTGLGLAISRSIIERLSGRIWAENNPDRGATFKFTLPRARRCTGGRPDLIEAPTY